jgi:signal transduction histidine kinase
VSLRARIALLVAGVVVGAAIAGMTAVRLVSESRFRSLVGETDIARAEALVPFLEDYYLQRGSWEGIQQTVSAMSGMRGKMMGGRSARTPQVGRAAMALAEARIVITDGRGVVVADSTEGLLGTQRAPKGVEGLAIRAASGVVGTLYVGTMVDRGLGPADSAFLASIARAIIVAMSLAALVATAIGLVVAGRIAGPVRDLTRAAERAARGDLEVRVRSRVGGEIGRLSTAFNTMAGALQAQEEGRRRMVADSAHELRTPASLIQGTVEAMLDGVYPSDRSTLLGLHEETLRLSRLVEDLGELSLLEAGRLALDRRQTDCEALARAEVERFSASAREAGIELTCSSEPGLPPALVDAGRIGQVVANLLSNALRHTPRGGQIEVSVTREGDESLTLSVQDSGPGIPEAERARVFERYYRLDDARSTASGGRGLGLAIAAGIVRAHGGTIRVGSAALGGASFMVVLPMVAQSASASSPGA